MSRSGVVIGGGAMRDGVGSLSVFDENRNEIKLIDQGQRRQDVLQQIQNLQRQGKGKGIKNNGNQIEV